MAGKRQDKKFTKTHYHMHSPRSKSSRMISRALYPTFASVLLAGCGSLPSSGPSSARILSEGESKKRQGDYNLIRVSQDVADTLRSREIASSDSGLSSLASPSAAKPGSAADRNRGMHQFGDIDSQTISYGDSVGVAIFTSGGGLFISPNPAATVGASQTALPPQVVDASGSITVPYIGRVKVLNRSVSDVEKEIVEGLKTKAIEPWVIVSVQERNGGDLVTVTGDAKLPARFPVPLSGMRVLDAIASAGGSGFRDYETMVSVMRGSKVRSEMLGEIIANSKKNVALQPGDTVILKARQWSYLTFGATGAQSRNAFPSTELSLAEALATARGLSDSQANPEAVFIYRFESQRTLEALGCTSGKVTPAGAPVIYQVNLREPNGFFIASQFSIRNKDIVFVGNAGTIGVIKAMGVVNTLTAPGRTALSTASGIDTLMP